MNTGLTEKETISPNLGALGDFQLFVNEFISFGNRFFLLLLLGHSDALDNTVKVFVVVIFFRFYFVGSCILSNK